MKVVILAGGLGTRLSEHTKKIPKPMVKIKSLPIIVHIMKHYVKFGYKEFYIAAGYKQAIIKNYFKKKKFGWKINVVDTGQKTMTGGRIKKLYSYLKNDRFFLTYGDGVSNVNLRKLLNFHKKNKDKLFIEIIFYLSDFYFKNLKDQNILKNDKVYELKSFVLDNLNKYLTFNLNQNSLINAINSKLNYG